MTMADHLNCTNCGISMTLPDGYLNNRRGDGRSFWCPNGHSMSYKETEADKLRRERDRLAQQIAQRDDEIRRQRELREEAERRVSAARGQVTRLKKRASAGVCPCCNRTFENLHRHMQTKHPQFAKEESNVVPLKAAG